jgi:hypothetical protein
MSTLAGPNIVRDNLVFFLEAASQRSYPGTGTTWYDMSGNKYNTTFSGSPTFQDSGNKTSINFSSTTADYASASFDEGILKQTNQTGDWTIEVTFKLVGTPNTTECLIAGRQGCNGGIYLYDNLTLYHAVKTDVCWTGHVGINQGTLTIGNWYHSIMTYTNGVVKSYLNGVYIDTQTLDLGLYDMSNYSNTFYVGGITGKYPNIDLATVRCYSVELSQEQVTQNYKSLRMRYNI